MKFMVGRPCYLKISDRKSRVDPTRPERVFHAVMPHNQITNHLGMIMNENIV